MLLREAFNVSKSLYKNDNKKVRFFLSPAF